MEHLESFQSEISQKLSETGKYLLRNQLAWGTSGNMSARLDEKTMLVTASGTEMGNLVPDDFTMCDIHTGNWEGQRKPSKELPMHIGIYQQRPDTKVVLHSSPFYTTLIACSNEQIDSSLFIESMYYLEDVAYVDYYHPGTKELGAAVKEKSTHANVIIMKNHGVILFDDSFADAVMRLETLEMASRMIVMAKFSGIHLNKLPDHTVSDFLENSIYKPRKQK